MAEETIIIPGEEYDPCKNVFCEDHECVDGDMYEVLCDDGVCIRGVLIDVNSTECPGYVRHIAKGQINSTSWEACHPKAGCSSAVAYWGSTVNVSVVAENVSDVYNAFKIRLTDKSNNSVLGEDRFKAISEWTHETRNVSFVMPSVPSLTLLLELIRYDVFANN